MMWKGWFLKGDIISSRGSYVRLTRRGHILHFKLAINILQHMGMLICDPHPIMLFRCFMVMFRSNSLKTLPI